MTQPDASPTAPGPVSLQIVPELYEMDYGRLAGRPFDEVKDELDQVLDAWRLGFVSEPFPGGESPILAQHRILPFAQRVLALARRHSVAVVAHGRINRILLATWTGAGLGHMDDYPQANAALSELAIGARVSLIRLNDTSHLSRVTDGFS